MDDWIIWAQLGAGIAIFIAITLVWLVRSRGGYFAVILKKQAGTYAKIVTMRFDPKDDMVRFGKKTFSIDLKNMGFRDDTARFLGGKFVYYLDYATNKQMSFLEFKSKIDAEDLDLLVSRNIISQLVDRLGNVNKMSIILMILGLCLGIAIGFIIGQFVHIGGIATAPITNSTAGPTTNPFQTPGA